MPQSLCIPVHDQSQVGEARREAALLADRIGLEHEVADRLSIATTEAGQNLYLHGGGGEILLNGLETRKQPCIELLAIDRGPGMDVNKCMRDGYSTSGTPGTGLGAISRLADSFDLYSAPGHGTVLLARFQSKRGSRRRPESGVLDYSAASIAYPGETLCGDAWSVRSSPSTETFLVADGLGHGEFAQVAAQEAVRVFNEANGAKPTEIIERAHGVLRSTRGAAVAIARIDHQQKTVIFSGVGNISALIAADGVSRNMVSLNGTVGHQIHRVQEFVYPWTADAMLIMHSDGLGTKWDLNSYPGLSQRSPGVIAGVLYRDFSRRRDDVTVLIARCPQS